MSPGNEELTRLECQELGQTVKWIVDIRHPEQPTDEEIRSKLQQVLPKVESTTITPLARGEAVKFQRNLENRLVRLEQAIDSVYGMLKQIHEILDPDPQEDLDQ